MSDLSWAFKVMDGMSGPASKMSSSVDRLASSMNVSRTEAKALEATLAASGKAMEAASKKASASAAKESEKAAKKAAETAAKIQGKGANLVGSALSRTPILGRIIGDKEKFAQGLNKAMGGALDGVFKKLGGLEESGINVGGIASMGMTALEGGAVLAGVAVAALIGGVVYLGYKLADLSIQGATVFTKMALEAGRFREDTMVSLTAMLKSTGAAQEVFDSATKFAATTPFKTDVVIGAYKSLLAGGFHTNELEGWMRSIGDLATIKGPEKIPEIISGLTKMRGEGKLTARTMMEFRSAGLSMVKVAEAAGLSDPEKLHGMKADKAEAAIKKAIAKAFGGASAMSAEALTGLLSTLQSQTEELFFATLKDAGSGVSKLYASLKGVVKDTLEFISGGGGDKITSVMNAIGNAINIVVVAFRSFVTGAMAGFSSAFDANKTGEALESWSKIDLSKVAEDASKLGKSVGKMADRFITWAAGADSKKIADQFGRLLDFVDRTLPKVEAFGTGFGKALGPLADMLAKLFSDSDETVDAATNRWELLGKVVGILGIGLGVVAAIVAVAAGTLMALPAMAVGALAGIVALESWLENCGVSLGASLVEGLIEGLTPFKFVDAMIDLAQVGIAAFRGENKVHSPSKVYSALGGFITLGVAQGVTQQAPRAQASIMRMASPRSLGFSAGAGGGIGGSASLGLGGLRTSSLGFGARDVMTSAPLFSKSFGTSFGSPRIDAAPLAYPSGQASAAPSPRGGRGGFTFNGNINIGEGNNVTKSEVKQSLLEACEELGFSMGGLGSEV